MRKFGMCLALTGIAVLSTGCGAQLGGQSSSARGGIAVVDLDRVAAETGKGIEMKEALQIQESGLKQQLGQAQNKAMALLDQKATDLQIKELKNDAPEENKREFQQIRTNLNNQLAKAQNDAGKILTNVQQSQLAKFRAELKPILNETAAKRGLSIVIPKNDGLLLSVDPGVDITDDVIKAYAAKRPTQSAPAAPAAPVQAAAPAPQAPAPVAAQTTAKPERARAAAREARETRELDRESTR